MLEHKLSGDSIDNRIIILGGHGFIGHTLSQKLLQNGCEVIALSRRDIDLSDVNALQKLQSVIKDGDVLIEIAADAPCKTSEQLIKNLTMHKTVVELVEKSNFSHWIYVSSDAVYEDSFTPLTEESKCAPLSMHGVMHLSREIMCRNSCSDVALGIVRPTLIYGALDPHNGYGPNQFRRLIESGQNIRLFGKGEERRDHVSIFDVTELLFRMIAHRSQGVINIASGAVHSFYEITQMMTKLYDVEIDIEYLKRNGPMPHNGYRAFDISNIKKAFPDFVSTQLLDGLEKIKDESEVSHA